MLLVSFPAVNNFNYASAPYILEFVKIPILGDQSVDTDFRSVIKAIFVIVTPSRFILLMWGEVGS